MLHSPTRDVVTMNEVVPIEIRKESHQTALLCWLSCLCSEFQQHMVVLLVHGAAVAFVKPSQMTEMPLGPGRVYIDGSAPFPTALQRGTEGRLDQVTHLGDRELDSAVGK